MWKYFTTLTVIAGFAAFSAAQDAPASAVIANQPLNDAWWTGPMLAPSANTLPRGHFLIEPYFFDVMTQGAYDSSGARRKAPHQDGFGSLTYLLYGLTNKISVGLIPTGGYNVVSNGPDSSNVQLGDLTAQGQYRLHLFHEGSWLPTTSVAVQETFPTGHYQNLGAHTSNGFGSGAYTTTLALYSQTFFWLPNHRILRTRLNLTQSLSTSANIHGVSVYGTSTGFSGHADPGRTFYVDSSWEYSLTRKWVPAIDLTYRHQGNTPLTGNILDSTSQFPTFVRINSGPSDAFDVAPAIEYSWKSSIGVLLGVRIVAAGRNTADTVTPALAINYVH